MNTLKVIKEGDRFEAILPVAGYRYLPFKFLLLSIILFIYGFIASIISFNESLGLQHTLIPYLILLFTAMTILSLIGSLALMFSEVIVSMSQEEFTLTRSFFGIQRSYITDINNISPICLEEVTLKVIFSTIYLIVIYDIGCKHYIGAWLEEEDRNVLYFEMIKHLSQFQHETIQYSSSN